MFEYINPVFVMLGLLILFTFSMLVIIELDENRKQGRDNIRERLTATVFILLAISFIFWDEYDTKKSLINNIADFNRGIALECKTRLNIYLVQKSIGWHLYERNFLKDDLLIPIKNCRSAL